MKLFLAIDASELSIDTSSFKKLKHNLSNKKVEHFWIPQNQWHIPLCNIGDIERNVAFGLNHKLMSIVTAEEDFELKLSAIWGYPKQKEAMTLWMGVQNSKALRVLQGELSEIVESNFFPHLPLIHFKSPRDVTDTISPYKNMDFGRLHAVNLILYEFIDGPYPNLKHLFKYRLNQSRDISAPAY